jgi:hypothetical protein
VHCCRFAELGVPIAGIIENMSSFTDPSGATHYPFGTTQLDAVCAVANVDAADALRLPIEAAVNDACDEGSPVVVARPDSATAHALRAAAAQLTTRLAQLQRPHAAPPAPQLRYDPTRGIVMRVLHGVDEGREFVLPREALAALPGAPDAARRDPLSALPAGLSMGVAEGEPAVVVRWDDGGESKLPLDELKRRGTP